MIKDTHSKKHTHTHTQSERESSSSQVLGVKQVLSRSSSWDGTAVSQGRHALVVAFHTQCSPEEVNVHSSLPRNAAQLTGENRRTSLSRRLLKPPNTYIILRGEREREFVKQCLNLRFVVLPAQ